MSIESGGYFGSDSAQEQPQFQDYVLKTPMNIYGMFFPSGIVYRQINSDWWHPIVNGSQLPSYAVHFMVIKNNETYFEPIK